MKGIFIFSFLSHILHVAAGEASSKVVDWHAVRGFNYQPSFGSNAMEIWLDNFNAATVRRELVNAKKIFPGMNTVRIWLAPEPYLRSPDAFLENVSAVFEICAELHLRVIPVLFNHWKGKPDFGGHPEGVANDPAQDVRYLPYLNAVLERWGGSGVVLAWDLCNEPDSSLTNWLKRTYAAAKKSSARQPFGISIVLLEQLKAIASCSDILMFHPYSNVVPSQQITGMIKFAEETGKPILATECCWGELDDAKHVELIKKDLDILKNAGVGFVIHALCESPVADLHRADLGPVDSPGYMAFINRDGSLRKGHEIFNDYCEKQKTTYDFNDSVEWLEHSARKIIRDAARKTPSGVTAFPPQVGCGYEAFWLRDYAYMLETCPDAFSKDELLAACRLFVGAIGSTDNAGVDCIKFSGEPVYKPGYGTMGSKPVADGSQFTVNVAWSTWKFTKDDSLLAEVADPLMRTMKAVPLNQETGLVHISSASGEARCPYGFTDTIKKRGDILFCSLLYIQACERLAEMLKACGRGSDASGFLAAASKAKTSVNSVLWDEATGLYLAA
ncbi:MAG: hypothetical protein PHT27_07860, partial [Candidatus Izemoplasmatales bacterium]|nr:hypothetical protein [Candidatus Izemoplasmatales bacterium]